MAKSFKVVTFLKINGDHSKNDDEEKGIEWVIDVRRFSITTFMQLVLFLYPIDGVFEGEFIQNSYLTIWMTYKNSRISLASTFRF